jgi:hypothetical protein
LSTRPSENKENKLIGLFICLDDFCQALQEWKKHQPQFAGEPTNHPLMSDSEMLTILVYYQFSGYKRFAAAMLSVLLSGICRIKPK